jgi:CRP/FNR family transcriptional regulator, cyclic AMP receptor protein
MFLPKSNVFKDLNHEAINDISEVAHEETYQQGTVLFAAKDPANHFYILVEGSVKLTIGEENRKEYLVKNLGETFGWSSVVGNRFYTAQAECLIPTTLLKIAKSDLEKVFDTYEESGRRFFQSLAKALGHRLIDLYLT